MRAPNQPDRQGSISPARPQTRCDAAASDGASILDGPPSRRELFVKSAPLGEIAEIDRSTVRADEITSGTTYVGLENIDSQGSFNNVETVAAGEIRSNKFRFDDDHILYGRLRPYLAKVAMPAFSGVCSTDILPIRPGPEIEPRFLLHYLRTPPLVDHASARATGANLPRLNPKALAEFTVPLPPIEEQRRIAAVLDAADALRAKRRAALAKLETLTQSIFIDMFGDPVANTRDWRFRTLGDVCSLIQIGPFGSLLHQSDYTTGGIPVVNPMHIVNGAIVPREDQTVPTTKAAELETYVLQEFDIVMGRRGEMGRVAVVSAPESGYVCGSGSLFLRVDPELVTPTFIAGVLSSPAGRSQLERSAQGVTMPNLNSTIVKDFALGIPPLDLQHRFDKLLDTQQISLRSNRDQGAHLDTLFAALQQKAFRGEL